LRGTQHPDFSAETAVANGALVLLLQSWEVVGGFADRLYAVRPYTPHIPRAVSAFVAHLREALARRGQSQPAVDPSKSSPYQ